MGYLMRSQLASMKQWYMLTKAHDDTSMKTVIFTLTSVITSNFTQYTSLYTYQKMTSEHIIRCFYFITAIMCIEEAKIPITFV